MNEPLITLTGRIGKDPELRFTPAGKAVTKIPVAVTAQQKNQNGEWEDKQTAWYEITLWGRTAETVADQLTKGQLVLVTGTLDISTYQTKDGETRTTLAVTANTIAVVPTGTPKPKTEPQAETPPW